MLTDDATLRQALAPGQTIALVGASDKPDRPSNRVMRYLLDQGYRVIPVNPSLPEVLGQHCWPTLRDIPEPVDLVDVFRQSADAPAVAAEAVAIGARTLWLQLGVISEAAAATARAAGLEVVMDRCSKIEHARLLGQGAAA